MPAEPPVSFTADESLLSLCPRQVLLRHLSPMAKTKSSGGSADASGTVVEENSSLLLRQSVAAYLSKSGFSDSLSAFLSEAKVQDWKTHSLDLELIFDKHLKSSGYPSETNYSKTSKQELENVGIDQSKRIHNSKKKQKKSNLENVETSVVKNGDDVKELQIVSGEKKKKKSKLCSEISDCPQHVNSQMNHDVVYDMDDEKSEGKLKEKEMKSLHLDPNENEMKVSKSDTQTIEFEGGKLLKEKDGQQKGKMKKKHKLHAVGDVLNPENECLLVDKKNKTEAKLGETQVKSKEKKQKHKTGAGADDDSRPKSTNNKNESKVDLDETVEKPKDKKKKKKNLNDSAKTTGEENGVDIEIKESKKRKRLALEQEDGEIELNDIKVTKKVTLDEKEETKLVSNSKEPVSGADPYSNKKMRIKKNEEGSMIANGTASDLKSKEQRPEDDEALVAAASAGNSEKNGFTQKSTKKDYKGSTEPKINPFCRIKVDSVTFADDRLQDNSYWAKDGADTGYGAKAQEVLGQVRGRDFRHEKTKKKRGSYRGGQIDFNSHSVKFNYSDGE